MKFYKIYQHPAGYAEAVKIGWSWPAFFFMPFWALTKRLWLLALILFALPVLACYINPAIPLLFDGSLSQYDKLLALATIESQHYVLIDILSIASIAINLFVAAKGNELREASLKKRGYVVRKTIADTNHNNALMKFMNEQNQSSDTKSETSITV